MKFSAVLSSLAAVVVASMFSKASAETVQTAANVFNTRPYLWVEGESYSSLKSVVPGDYNDNNSVDAADYVRYRNGGPLNDEVALPLGTTDSADYDAWRARFGNSGGLGWKTVTKGGPDVSFITAGGTALPILPATSNVSGSAIFAQQQITSHTHLANYEMKFITAGTYQFYLRLSLYDTSGNGNFLNEDSIFLPPAFNKNSSTDWVGFQGLSFDENDVTVDIPTPGFAVDPDGWKPQAGDHQNDGLLELANWGIKDDGVWTQHTPAGTLASNGNFNWYNRPAYQGTTGAGGFDGFFGMKTEFTVTPEMVGQTVTFELGTREVNVVIDGFMFIQMGTPADIYPNSDLLDLYSQAEVDAGVLPGPGAGASVGAVPEPASLVLFLMGIVAFRGTRIGRSC